MAENKSGQTAFGAAAVRLIKQYQPSGIRLFNDPVIKGMLNRATVFLLQFKSIRNWMLNMFDSKTEGIAGGLICRTKYIDEKTQTALHDGIGQILILGSGMDTRPYRIPGIEKVKVFEVDLASVQQFKKKRIKQYLGYLPEHVIYASIDFNAQSISEVLSENQFDLSKPTFIICEGVTQYITPDAVKEIFAFISTTAPGSFAVFTYILESVINKKSTIKGANELMEFFEKRNSPWRFGIEPNELELFFKKYGLSLMEEAGVAYYQGKYLQPIKRHLTVTEIERVAFVKKK